MFTIDDLWRIMSYLKDGTTDASLSALTTTLATSEKELVTTFFEQIIDQQVFDTDDYRRLRSMLIDWYSSHKTIATTQRYASDVHQLPNIHLSELFKSFGFPLGLDLVPLTSKANFFLDLVNFYKKKGTPETIVDVLDYYGFSDTDLVEYWLEKNDYDEIVFRGESVRLAATGSTILLDSNVPFEKLTGSDPHWFQTKDQIEYLHQHNKINLPSKSPYYSLSSIFSLFTISISLSILFRIVSDQYDRYDLGEELPYNTSVRNLGIIVPILHVYVGTIYAFEKMFGYGTATSFNRCSCYDGTIEYEGTPPIPTNLSDLVDEYEELISRPTSKEDRDTRLATLIDTWSRPMSENFLNSINAAEPLLESLNPNFKAVIDSWFAIEDESYLITYLIGTLDTWIRQNIDSKSPSLVITMLGLGFREELDAIMNFFKPYRARLAFMDTAFSIKNPLAESVILGEWLETSIETEYRDAIRPYNFPFDYCINGDLSQPPAPVPAPEGYAGYYSKFMWDMGGVFDIPPIDQLDSEYMERLNSYLQSLHIGTICDNVITSIEMTFKEILGDTGRYDTGDFYDSLPTRWLDSFTMQIDTGESGFDDSILVNDQPEIQLNTTISDNFGLEPPTQFDVGQSFDTLHPKSVVTDDFHIDIESFILGEASCSTNVTGVISFGSAEIINSNINITSSILNTELTIGVSEILTSTNTIISVVVNVPLLMVLNYYFDYDGVFDTPPKAT